MKEVFNQIISNRVFMTTLLAWVVAQTIKVGIGVVREKRFDFRWFVGSGGMPSSHTAGVSCLATTIGLGYGFSSVHFALAALFAIVVMFDAQSVRRTIGKQAHILNKIMEDIYWRRIIHETRLRELIGHTPIEIIVGFLLGVTIALLAR